MTVDVNVKSADEAMLEDLDEIMEDAMVQLFVLQPRDREALEAARETASEYEALFYCAPLSLRNETDANCVAYFLDDASGLEEGLDKPLFVNDADLDDGLIARLVQGGYRGVILDATRDYEPLEAFHLALGPGNVERFGSEALNALSMDRIVLQSGYPDAGFDAIYPSVKKISDAMFRPEQSIIARATKSSLVLLGFRKA